MNYVESFLTSRSTKSSLIIIIIAMIVKLLVHFFNCTKETSRYFQFIHIEPSEYISQSVIQKIFKLETSQSISNNAKHWIMRWLKDSTLKLFPKITHSIFTHVHLPRCALCRYYDRVHTPRGCALFNILMMYNNRDFPVLLETVHD